MLLQILLLPPPNVYSHYCSAHYLTATTPPPLLLLIFFNLRIFPKFLYSSARSAEVNFWDVGVEFYRLSAILSPNKTSKHWNETYNLQRDIINTQKNRHGYDGTRRLCRTVGVKTCELEIYLLERKEDQWEWQWWYWNVVQMILEQMTDENINKCAEIKQEVYSSKMSYASFWKKNRTKVVNKIKTGML